MGTCTSPPPTECEIRELDAEALHDAARRLEFGKNPHFDWWNNKDSKIKQGISCREPYESCEVYLIEYGYSGGRGCGWYKANLLAFVPSQGGTRPTTHWVLPEWIAEAVRKKWPNVKQWKLITWELRRERVVTTLRENWD